jgi:hypothetical protein
MKTVRKWIRGNFPLAISVAVAATLTSKWSAL